MPHYNASIHIASIEFGMMTNRSLHTAPIQGPDSHLSTEEFGASFKNPKT